MFWPAIFGGLCVLFVVAIYMYIRLLMDMFVFVMVVVAVVMAVIGVLKLRRLL